MPNCPNCNSSNVIKSGFTDNTEYPKQRYKCKDCPTRFVLKETDNIEIDNFIEVTKTSESKKWVITSAINDTKTNTEFLETLLSYCEVQDAELMIIPIKYKNDYDLYTWDQDLDNYLIDENTNLSEQLVLFAGIQVSPTMVNPLTSFEYLSRGRSAIIPHPQIMMKCVAVNHIDKAAILHSTGCVSLPEYTTNKSGERANISHSMAALVVELDESIDDFHIRVLNSDDNGGFYDLDSYYHKNHIKINERVPAIVVGDEHVVHLDETVVDATFDNEDSMVNVLNPKYIVRHDVLDFYSSNHHHRNDFFLQYKKYQDNTHIVEDELADTANHLIRTTPKNATSIVVSSNHNDHLTRWLQECNPKTEAWNAKLYHRLMYLKLDSIEDGESLTPFELWYNDEYNFNRLEFIKESDTFVLHDIELALHGHYGINGSRGSATQYSKLGMKTIIGHSHTPMIIGDCFQVGHSCKAKMGYNKGPSSWNNAHCIIHPDGSRQMIFIKKGKWRL